MAYKWGVVLITNHLHPTLGSHPPITFNRVFTPSLPPIITVNVQDSNLCIEAEVG